MEFLSAYLLSPSSVIVALLTVLFLTHQSWIHLSRSKKSYQTYRESPKVDYTHNIAVSKEPDVPEGWWSGREVFELERRAVFSKSWLYLAHVTQFSKAGAYQSFDIAGFPVFLIRSKDDKIRAFHNVCRHRAYTITRKETGTSTVLGCRYHGWSYDTTGRLVKAPQFDGIRGFKKAENGLFEIHTHTTDHGMVFVNLNAGEPFPFPSSTVSDIDRFSSATRLGSKSRWLAGQTLTGTFNWKFAMNFSYCTDITRQLEEIVSAVSPPSATAKFMKFVTQNSSRADCHLFPGNFLYSFEDGHFWISIAFIPASESTTQVRYDLFSLLSTTKNNEGELTNTIAESITTLLQKIGIEFSSATTGSIEIGSNTTQILDQLQEHLRLEKKNGSPILPAMRQPKGSSLFQQAEQLCKEIDCAVSGSGSSSGSNGLDW